MTQLILHLLGDYVTQSDWMAQNKAKAWMPAFAHALTYSFPFLCIGTFTAFLVISSTHLVIDRFRLARYLVIAKNAIGDPAFWQNHNRHIEQFVLPKYDTPTGYPADSPAWLTTWLMIAADNTLHLSINALALRYL